MKTPVSQILPEVDVELVLEGSYPYVTGGVSSWVHQIILGMPNLRFGLVHLGAKKSDKRDMKYSLPPNVGYLQNMYLHEPVFFEETSGSGLISTSDFFPQLFHLHEIAKSGNPRDAADLIRSLANPKDFGNLRQMLFCEEGFAMLTRMYQTGNPEASFLDFFWTWRFMHLPLLQLFQARRGPAKIVHTVSTGYAGAYGALRTIVDNLPLVLTEHGIYTRERHIEITQASWIASEVHPDHLVRTTQGTFKRLWMNFFQALSHWTYVLSERIITLFEGNRSIQIQFGANPEKTEIIPNGITIQDFWELRPHGPPDPDAFTVGFVGRVVSIKDIRTLVTAAQIVLLKCPRALFLIIGPLDEEPEYAVEMQDLVARFQMTDRIRFLGRQQVRDWYPKLDISVLTSLSEGQPLTILETMAAGIPTVATDIGGCRELLEGRTPEDKALGVCGRVTNLRAPEETAQAILDLCRNHEQYLQMARIGKIRVKTFYLQEKVLERYGRIYQQLLSSSPSPKGEKGMTS
jgi:glycosyltransferase involved in cell wall biosynthesis